LLTKDLTEISGGDKNQYPKFYEMVIRPNELTLPDQTFRQTYLKRYAQNDLLAQVMAYWKGHLQNFVPKPEDAQKLDYTHHAHWMAALRELAWAATKPSWTNGGLNITVGEIYGKRWPGWD
jgi:hypothetical protein